MPPKPKTEAERQQLRTLILDAARELFAIRGLDAVTMREIAKKIGYSSTAIYLHFKDKDSLIRELCDTDFLALASNLNRILEIKHPVERMMALGQGYAQFALTHPNHYRIMFMSQRPNCNPDESAIPRGNAEHDAYAQLKLVVQDVYDQGMFIDGLTDTNLIAQTIWAGIHGVCSLQISLASDAWIEWSDISARINLMQQMILRGLIKA